MAADITSFPAQPDLVEGMKGPVASGCQVIIEGRAIPRLRMIDRQAEIDLILDGRFILPVPRELAHVVAWFVANALAIGEGYPFLGALTKERPFAPLCTRIDGLPPKEDQHGAR